MVDNSCQHLQYLQKKFYLLENMLNKADQIKSNESKLEEKMVKRPAWSIKGDRLICESFEFEWNEGFAITQKQKNIANFHKNIKSQHWKYHQKELYKPVRH